MSINRISEEIRKQTIEVHSFCEVSLREMMVPVICIYTQPKDYPDKVVARIFDLEGPTNILLVRDTIQEVREDINRAYPWLVRFDRLENDLPSIVETWL